MDVTTPSSASQAKARAQGWQSFIISSRSGLLTFYIEGLCAVKVRAVAKRNHPHVGWFRVCGVSLPVAEGMRCARREGAGGAKRSGAARATFHGKFMLVSLEGRRDRLKDDREARGPSISSCCDMQLFSNFSAVLFQLFQIVTLDCVQNGSAGG